MVRSREPWSLNAGYYKMPEATAAGWRNGWFHTGDSFKRDEDGWFFFVDRTRDTIRRRGENISSFEVENAVMEYPGIVECTAIGIRTPLGDDEVLAAIIVHEPESFDPAALIEFLEPRMAEVHGAALRGSDGRLPAQRDHRPGPQARAPRPRPERRHLGPRRLTVLASLFASHARRKVTPKPSLVLAEDGVALLEEGLDGLAVVGGVEGEAPRAPATGRRAG